jgi:long-chain acyl-CoA synthetase
MEEDKATLTDAQLTIIESAMEQNRQQLNTIIPSYSKLVSIEIHEEEFAKTPKKSIKRYLYQ